MGRMFCRGVQGMFPIEGGSRSFVKGVCTWRIMHSPGAGEKCTLSVGFKSRKEPLRMFPRTDVAVNRAFVRRLGACDDDAHAELVEMVDWRKTIGPNASRVRSVAGFAVHAIRGNFPATARVCRDGEKRAVRGGASWKARWPGGVHDMRHIVVHLGTGDDDPFGEALVDEDFIGDLAADMPNARESLIARMGWDAEEFGVSLR